MIASGVYAKFNEDFVMHVEGRIYVTSIADGRLTVLCAIYVDEKRIRNLQFT